MRCFSFYLGRDSWGNLAPGVPSGTGGSMLKSCKYCGKITAYKHDCPNKPQRKKQGNDKDRFRWTKAWQDKRDEIKERDKYLCQVCAREGRYTYDGLEVHHAVPLEDDFDKRLDNDNLITLCERHHEMAERGEISREVIINLIRDRDIPPGGID